MKKLARHSRESGNPVDSNKGIFILLDSRFRGNDGMCVVNYENINRLSNQPSRETNANQRRGLWDES